VSLHLLAKKLGESSAKPKLGSGGRFAAGVAKIEGEGLSKDAAGAIMANAGRKAHGQAAMTKWSKAARK
jgi:hypothetical protein